MRKQRNHQRPLIEETAGHPKAKEFARISEVLDIHHSICELALQDFDRGDNNVRANGMTVEQIIRATFVKQTEGYRYRALAFHLQYPWSEYNMSLLINELTNSSTLKHRSIS